MKSRFSRLPEERGDDPLADGLYADVGAEHFYKPGYDVYWRYWEEFKLPIVAYPRRDQMIRVIEGRVYTEEDLQSRGILSRLGLNQREVDFLKDRPWWDLPLLYLQPYVDQIQSESRLTTKKIGRAIKLFNELHSTGHGTSCPRTGQWFCGIQF
jgi:hypothetical protein